MFKKNIGLFISYIHCMQTQNENSTITRQYQVIERKDWFFHKTHSVIFNPEKFKSPEDIQEDQKNYIKERKPRWSMFSSVKVVNVQHTGTWSINISF